MLRGLMGILVRVVPAARQARLDMVTGDPQRKDGHLRVHCQDARSFRCLQIVAIVALPSSFWMVPSQQQGGVSLFQASKKGRHEDQKDLVEDQGWVS
jgi:hypothetical protein